MTVRDLIVAVGGVFAIAAAGGLGQIDAQATRSIWDGVYTSDQAERGGQLYDAWCAL